MGFTNPYHVTGEGGKEKVLVIIWLEEVTEKSFGNKVVRKEVMENVFALRWFEEEVTFPSLSLDNMKVGKKGGDEREVEELMEGDGRKK